MEELKKQIKNNRIRIKNIDKAQNIIIEDHKHVIHAIYWLSCVIITLAVMVVRDIHSIEFCIIVPVIIYIVLIAVLKLISWLRMKTWTL